MSLLFFLLSERPKIPSANRGNDLLIGILKHRYPYLLTDNAIAAIRLWLGAKSEAERYRIYTDHVSQHKSMIEPFIKSYIEENSCSYPMDFGKLKALQFVAFDLNLHKSFDRQRNQRRFARCIVTLSGIQVFGQFRVNTLPTIATRVYTTTVA
jgi:hypothetical protein